MSCRCAAIVLLAVLAGCQALPVRSFGDGRRHAVSVAFSPDGQLLAGGLDDGSVRVWDVASGRELARQSGFDTTYAALPMRVAFSPDSRRLVYAADGGYVRVWSIFEQARPMRLAGHDFPVNRVAFAPDGVRILSSSGGLQFPRDGLTALPTPVPLTVLVHHLRTGQVLWRMDDDEPGVICAAFAPGGDMVATVWAPPSAQCTTRPESAQITLRDLRSGTTQRIMHTADPVLPVEFSPDGQLLLTGKSAWDVQTGVLICRLDANACTFVDSRTVLVMRQGFGYGLDLTALTPWFQPVYVDVFTEEADVKAKVASTLLLTSMFTRAQFTPDFRFVVDQGLRMWKLPR